MQGERSLVKRWLVALGKFWWDFLVGDTPELLIGVLVALGVVALLVRAASLNSVAVVSFPALVIVLLAASSLAPARPSADLATEPLPQLSPPPPSARRPRKA